MFVHFIPVSVQTLITFSEIVLFETHTLRRILKQKIQYILLEIAGNGLFCLQLNDKARSRISSVPSSLANSQSSPELIVKCTMVQNYKSIELGKDEGKDSFMLRWGRLGGIPIYDMVILIFIL